MQSFPDLARRLANCVDDVAVDELHLQVGKRRRFLHCCEGGDERWKLVQLDAADAKVLDRAKGLNPVQRPDRHIALAQQVTLPAGWSGEIDAGNVGH